MKPKKRFEKLQKRMAAWRDIAKHRGSVVSGPGRRYPDGYRCPGSLK